MGALVMRRDVALFSILVVAFAGVVPVEELRPSPAAPAVIVPPAEPTEEESEPAEVIEAPDGTKEVHGEQYKLVVTPEDEPGYEPRVIQYSPASWDCQWCPVQKRAIEGIKNPPFTVEFRKRDNMGTYPQVWFTTPDGDWKQWKGYVDANTILTHWRKYHDCPAKNQTAQSPGNPDVEKSLTIGAVQAMNATQLRDLIRRWGTPLPRSGTVVGMTVTYHLLNDHGFSNANLSGLSDGERHSVHQIAHNITDGRVTAKVTTATASPAVPSPAPGQTQPSSPVRFSKKQLRRMRKGKSWR